MHLDPITGTTRRERIAFAPAREFPWHRKMTASAMSMHQLHWKRSARKTERQVELRATLVLPPLLHLVASDPMREGFRHLRMDWISRPDVVD
jgi:hypothetical protein